MDKQDVTVKPDMPVKYTVIAIVVVASTDLLFLARTPRAWYPPHMLLAPSCRVSGVGAGLTVCWAGAG